MKYGDPPNKYWSRAGESDTFVAVKPVLLCYNPLRKRPAGLAGLGRARRFSRAGSILIEASAAMALLVAIGLMLMRGSLNTLSGRYWTMSQMMSDAYLTYEGSLAQRVPMDDVVGGSSLWPLNDPAQTTVEIGKLPGGRSVTAVVHRQRVPDANNLPSAGGSGTEVTNPAGMEVWKLEAHLVYTIRGETYRKSRTVVRVR